MNEPTDIQAPVLQRLKEEIKALSDGLRKEEVHSSDVEIILEIILGNAKPEKRNKVEMQHLFVRLRELKKK